MPGNWHFCAPLAECMFLKGEFFFLYTCETTAHLDSPDIFSLGLCLSKASFQARSINSSLLFFEEEIGSHMFLLRSDSEVLVTVKGRFTSQRTKREATSVSVKCSKATETKP